MKQNVNNVIKKQFMKRLFYYLILQKYYEDCGSLKNFVEKYIDEECCNNIRTDYELYAIANHSGTIDYGHYFAYIKIDNNWYEFNDSSVHQIGRIDTSSSNAYVLFFKRSDV